MDFQKDNYQLDRVLTTCSSILDIALKKKDWDLLLKLKNALLEEQEIFLNRQFKKEKTMPSQEQIEKGYIIHQNTGATKATAAILHRRTFKEGTYKTRSGKLAQVNRVEFDMSQYPLKGTVDGSPKTWTTNGKHNIFAENDPMDLVENL